jgi:hypothetical protein
VVKTNHVGATGGAGFQNAIISCNYISKMVTHIFNTNYLKLLTFSNYDNFLFKKKVEVQKQVCAPYFNLLHGSDGQVDTRLFGSSQSRRGITLQWFLMNKKCHAGWVVTIK